MIRVKKSHTLLQLMKKVQKEKSSEIFLDFPIGHHILHDYNALCILKKMRSDTELVVITKDLSATHYLKKAWIKYTLIRDEQFLKKNILQNQDLLKNNTGFFEYLFFFLKKQKERLLQSVKEKKQNTNPKSFPFIIIGATLFVSWFLLLFIFYFAVHKTTIYMTPETEIIQVQKNFRFKNNAQLSINENTIKLQEKVLSVEISDNFPATNIEYGTSKQAAWIITIFNELEREQSLIAETRFVSEEWIIYRLQNRITVPASTISESGEQVLWEINARVTADPFDTNGYYVWTRGNAEDLTLTVPWLTWELKNRVYAKSASLQWWSDEYEVIIWEEDLENAAKLLRTKLESEAVKQLGESIDQDNELNGENYELLALPGTLQYSDFQFTNSDWAKVWDTVKQFELSGSLRITWLVYNKSFVAAKLRKVLDQKTLEDVQEIEFINDDSVRIAHTIISSIENSGSWWTLDADIKATMELEAWVSRIVSETGYWVELLKNRIMWLSETEAYDILLNTNNVSNVEIRNSPFFVQKITTKPQNIFFKIRK